MVNNEIAFALKLVICLTLMVSYDAYQEIKVFRLVQYEVEEKVYGSQYTSLNYIGAHYKGDLLRKIALIKLKDLSSIDELKKYINSNANALLFILPKLNSVNDEFKSFLLETQNYLSEQILYIPVYFTEENDNVNEVYQELEEIGKIENPENYDNTHDTSIFGFFKLENNLLQFSLSASDSKKSDTLNFENIYGYLESAQSPGGAQTNNIIAIVANYDDLSIAPDFPPGLNSNASSVIAMIEIIRILSKFYENYDSFAKYDLMFLMTSGGALNYYGDNHFISNFDSSILENIQYILCLDSISEINNENQLYVHLSRYPKEEEDLAFRFQKVSLIIKDFYIIVFKFNFN